MLNPIPQVPQYELVAKIEKTKGLDGQLVARELGRLSVLRPGLEVWIVPPTMEGTRHTTVTEARDDFKKHGVLVSLEGIDDRTKATEVIGRYLLASKEQVAMATQLLDSTYDYDDESRGEAEETPDTLLNTGDSVWRAQDRGLKSIAFFDTKKGDLGCLESIKPGPAYDIWVIEGPYGRLEIPAVDDYVSSEDDECITLTLPQGFIEIVTGMSI